MDRIKALMVDLLIEAGFTDIPLDQMEHIADTFYEKVLDFGNMLCTLNDD